MTDREKVVRAVETCFDSWIDKHRNMDLDLHEVKRMKRDALELLKEQEPVAPVMVSHSRGIAWNCGYCGTEIDVIQGVFSVDAIPKMYRYCRMCGARIKWKVSV